MNLRIIPVKTESQAQLIKYSSRYGSEHDSSYLPGRDFEITAEHPGYLLMDGSLPVGAVCLMRTKRFRSVGKGRFSIFHSTLDTREAYTLLLEAIRPHIQDLTSVYLFIPEEKEITAGILRELGFEVERFSFILQREGSALPEPVFPEGIHVQPLDPQDLVGLGKFAACLNEEFKDLAGHTPSTPEDVRTWFDDQSYLEGGLCLLVQGDQAIGTIAMGKDLDDQTTGEIMAFGIRETYRGRGLGRSLFRYGNNFLFNRGFQPVTLSVNGENQDAIRLYRSEGFVLTESVVCYSLASNT